MLRKIVVYIWAFLTLSVLPCLYMFPSMLPYDEKRIMQVGLLMLVGLVFLSEKFSLHTLSGHGIPRPYKICKLALWGIVSFGMLGLVSVWNNHEWFLGLQELGLYLLLFVVFLFVARCYRQNSPQFENALYLMIAAYAGFYILKVGISYGMYLSGNYPLWPDRYSVSTLYGWSNIRFFNQVQTWMLPLLITAGLFFRRRSKLVAWLAMAFAAFWWCLVFASGAQGTMVAVGCASLLILMLFRRRAWNWVKAAIYTCAAGGVGYFALFYFHAGGGASVIDNSTKGRFRLWAEIWDKIIHRPLLGYGPLSLGSVSHLPSMTHPHNVILRMMYEFGTPATLLALGMVGWGMVRWLIWNRQTLPHVSPRQRYVRIGLSVALCAGLAHSLVSGVMIMPLSQLWFCIVAGWAWGIYNKRERNLSYTGERFSASNHSRWQKTLVWSAKAMVIAAVLWMGFILWHDVPRLKQYHRQYVKHHNVGYVPRFWQQGKIGIKR